MSILYTALSALKYDKDYAAYKQDITNLDAPSAPVAAVLSGIFCVDEDSFYMTANGNWNPQKDFGGLEGSRATCLLGPTAETVWKADYPLIMANVKKLLNMGRCGDG